MITAIKSHISLKFLNWMCENAKIDFTFSYGSVRSHFLAQLDDIIHQDLIQYVHKILDNDDEGTTTIINFKLQQNKINDWFTSD